MQIRESIKTVMFIRFHYDSEKKRTYGKVFASQPITNQELDSDIEKMMTPEEKEEFSEWRKEKNHKLEIEAKSEALNSFVAQAKLASEAIIDKEITKSKGDDDWAAIWAALDEMSKALRKAKIKKPDRKSKPVKSGKVDALPATDTVVPTNDSETTDTAVPANDSETTDTAVPANDSETTDTAVDSNEPSSKQ